MGEEHVIDEAVNEEMDDSLERAAATAISLDAKVESSDEDEGLGEEDASKHRRISDIDADEGITLVSTHDDTKMFDADQDLHGEEVFVTKQNENVVEKEVDVAQVQVSTAVTTPTISIDKATLDQALTELKHANLRPRLKGYYQLAKRLQVEEQQELNNEEKATLFMQLLEKRRKFFEAKRAEEKRNKPPIQAQQKKCMMFDRAFKRVNTFVNFKTELVKESFKKAEVVVTEGEEGVAIDAIPLAVKPPSIVDWKIIKEGKKTYYQIIRADGSSKMYLVFSHMLKDFDREDVETLWKMVKAKHGSTRPEEGYERVL
nr:hypothetical protein [Tanacetum cinerariifolium]